MVLKDTITIAAEITERLKDAPSCWARGAGGFGAPLSARENTCGQCGET
jgi:hypothetical protein